MHDQTCCTTHPLYNPARQGNWPQLLTYSLRTLYVKTDIQVEKALGLIFGQSTTTHTRHFWPQILLFKSCWMYLDIRIFLVNSTTSQTFSVNVKWLILFYVQILNSRLHTGLYSKWGKAKFLIITLAVTIHSTCKFMYKFQNCIITHRLIL